jgi:hypothetical protein
MGAVLSAHRPARRLSLGFAAPLTNKFVPEEEAEIELMLWEYDRDGKIAIDNFFRREPELALRDGLRGHHKEGAARSDCVPKAALESKSPAVRPRRRVRACCRCMSYAASWFGGTQAGEEHSNVFERQLWPTPAMELAKHIRRRSTAASRWMAGAGGFELLHLRIGIRQHWSNQPLHPDDSTDVLRRSAFTC